MPARSAAGRSNPLSGRRTRARPLRDREGSPRAADTGIDDRGGGPRGRHVGSVLERTSAPCRTAVGGDPVGHVDDASVGRDPGDDSVACADEVVLQSRSPCRKQMTTASSLRPASARSTRGHDPVEVVRVAVLRERGSRCDGRRVVSGRATRRVSRTGRASRAADGDTGRRARSPARSRERARSCGKRDTSAPSVLGRAARARLRQRTGRGPPAADGCEKALLRRGPAIRSAPPKGVCGASRSPRRAGASRASCAAARGADDTREDDPVVAGDVDGSSAERLDPHRGTCTGSCPAPAACRGPSPGLPGE
jgi:hypothetical protein